MPASTGRDTIFRQWTLLQAIPREPQSTSAAQLHDKLRQAGYTVTRRTVERDLNTLMRAGFAVWVDDTQEPYLWSWRKSATSFSLPVPSVSDALLLAMVRDYLRPLLPTTMMDALAPYLDKADGVLGSAGKSNQLARWQGKVRVALPTQPLLAPAINPAVHATLSECLLQETQIDLTYASRSGGKTTALRVHPHALLQRGQVMYLLGTCWDYTDMRRLALHRIQAATNTYTPMAPLPGFNLDEFLKNGYADFGNGGMKQLDVRVAPSVAEHLMECRLSEDQRLTPVDEPEGWFQLQATVADTPQLEWWLRGFGLNICLSRN